MGTHPTGRHSLTRKMRDTSTFLGNCNYWNGIYTIVRTLLKRFKYILTFESWERLFKVYNNQLDVELFVILNSKYFEIFRNLVIKLELLNLFHKGLDKIFGQILHLSSSSNKGQLVH